MVFQGDYSLFDEIPSLSSSCDRHVSSGQWDSSHKEIIFIGKREDCCICFIDMVNSTKITRQLSQQQIAKYYSLFLNSIAIIAKNYGASIIKNAGDCLIYYFPSTSESDNKNKNGTDKLLSYKDVIECGMTIISAHSIINAKSHEENLPSLNYRISAEYGTVEFAQSKSSQNQDLFGNAMNFCAKINPYAPTNGMVIGNGLYQVVKSCSEYRFEKIDKLYDISLNNTDVAYIVKNKQQKTILNPFLRTTKLKTLQSNLADQTEKLKTINTKDFDASFSLTNITKKIMIVDDEEDILYTFKAILINEGYDVDGFTNSKKALQHFEKNQSYDIIITDIKMPNLNGLELYNNIKSKKNHIQVLFISALEGAEIILSVLPRLTEKNFIKKPLDGEKLIEATKRLLGETHN